MTQSDEKNAKKVRTVNWIGFIAGYFVALSATIAIDGLSDSNRLMRSILLFTVCYTIGTIWLIHAQRWGVRKRKPWNRDATS